MFKWLKCAIASIAAVQKATQEWEKDHGYLIDEINNVDIDT